MENLLELFYLFFLWLLLLKNGVFQYLRKCYLLPVKYIFPMEFHCWKKLFKSRQKYYPQSDQDDKHISKNCVTTMCLFISKILTVTRFIFFKSHIITTISIYTVTIVFHIIKFFCKSDLIALFKIQAVFVFPQV